LTKTKIQWLWRKCNSTSHNNRTTDWPVLNLYKIAQVLFTFTRYMKQQSIHPFFKSKSSNYSWQFKTTFRNKNPLVQVALE